MGSAGLTFQLFGEDVSASEAMDKVGIKADTVAKAAAAAFAGLKLGEAFSAGLENEKTLDLFTAGLGQTPEVAARAGQLAGDLYRQGIGESLEDVTNAVGAVGTHMVDLGTISQPELAKITSEAAAVAQVMGRDVTEVTRAAGAMMKNGLAPDAQTALDIIATGATNGADASGDLLDTLTEYGDSFSNIGIDGQAALGMMKAAMDGGAFSTDIAADAVREFGTRVLDGSAEASGAFSALGLDAAGLTAAIAGGGPAAKDAMSTIMSALSGMTDPLAREQAGVALFGSMWEDAGAKMVLSMNPAATALTDVAGAATTMATTVQDNAATKIDGIKRTFDGWLESAVALPGPLGTIVGAAAAIGPTAISMGATVITAAGALSNMGLVTKAVTAAQWLWNAAMTANPIGLIIAAIVALVAGFVWLWNNSEGFRNFFIGMWDQIKAVIAAVVDWFVAAWDWLFGVVRGIVETYLGFWRFVWDTVWAVVEGAVNFIVGLWTGFTDWISGIASTIGGFFTGLWDGVKNAASSVVDWIKGVFQGAVDWVTNVFNSVGSAIGSALGGIGDFLKSPINWVIDMLNWLIDRLNSISFDVPDWVPFIGGNHIGFNLGHIPRLADGGLVSARRGGTLAVLGEGGEDEMVTPLSRMSDVFGGGTVVNLTVHGFVGDKDQLSREFIEMLNGAQRRGIIPSGTIQIGT